jgi:hypothetical protein
VVVGEVELVFYYYVGYILGLDRILIYVYQCMCRSFVIFVHRGYVCGSVPIYLIGGPFFRCGIYPLFSLLCCICVLFLLSHVFNRGTFFDVEYIHCFLCCVVFVFCFYYALCKFGVKFVSFYYFDVFLKICLKIY